METWFCPGPRFWTFWFALLDVSSIWPFNVSNAAVVAAAAFLGHLPQEGVASNFLGLGLGSVVLALIASTAPLRLLQQIQPAGILRGE